MFVEAVSKFYQVYQVSMTYRWSLPNRCVTFMSVVCGLGLMVYTATDTDAVECGDSLCGYGTVCTNHTCVCIRGFEEKTRLLTKESKTEYCIEKCDVQGHGCSRNTSCRPASRQHGDHRCYCADGFVRMGLGHCIDHDECSEVDDACGGHSFCSNLVGSYRCICEAGYKPVEDVEIICVLGNTTVVSNNASASVNNTKLGANGPNSGDSTSFTAGLIVGIGGSVLLVLSVVVGVILFRAKKRSQPSVRNPPQASANSYIRHYNPDPPETPSVNVTRTSGRIENLNNAPFRNLDSYAFSEVPVRWESEAPEYSYPMTDVSHIVTDNSHPVTSHSHRETGYSYPARGNSHKAANNLYPAPGNSYHGTGNSYPVFGNSAREPSRRSTYLYPLNTERIHRPDNFWNRQYPSRKNGDRNNEELELQARRPTQSADRPEYLHPSRDHYINQSEEGFADNTTDPRGKRVGYLHPSRTDLKNRPAEGFDTRSKTIRETTETVAYV